MSLTLNGTNTETPAIGDFNGDGKLDLAVTTGTATSGTVHVLYGNGNGTFQPDQTFAVDKGPQYVIAVDLTGDGKLDLVTTNVLASDISVLLSTRRPTRGGRPLVYRMGDRRRRQYLSHDQSALH